MTNRKKTCSKCGHETEIQFYPELDEIDMKNRIAKNLDKGYDEIFSFSLDRFVGEESELPPFYELVHKSAHQRAMSFAHNYMANLTRQEVRDVCNDWLAQQPKYIELKKSARR